MNIKIALILMVLCFGQVSHAKSKKSAKTQCAEFITNAVENVVYDPGFNSDYKIQVVLDSSLSDSKKQRYIAYVLEWGTGIVNSPMDIDAISEIAAKIVKSGSNINIQSKVDDSRREWQREQRRQERRREERGLEEQRQRQNELRRREEQRNRPPPLGYG